MNWIRENRFLAALLGFFVLFGGIFGALLFTTYSRYAEVSETYDTQAAELLRLQSLRPYPDAENLKLLEGQKEMNAEVVNNVLKELGTLEIPLEPMTPEEFQDKLRASVSAVVSRAREIDPKWLPDKFYMGFDPYQTAPPSSSAAPLLGRQLKAIEIIMNMLIDANVDSLAAQIRRPPLPEEAATTAAGGGTAAAAKAAAAKKDPKSSLVTKHPVDISFIAEQNEFRTFLNNLVATKKQFFIPRTVVIRNEKETGPSRGDLEPVVDPTPAAQDPTPPAGTAGAGGVPPPSTEPTLRFVVGTERVVVTMRIEIVDFADPTAKPAGTKTTSGSE